VLRARGYSVIPLAPTQKYPVIDRWSDYCTRRPSDEEHARWMSWRSANVGLCLGEASGVIALDFDDDVNGLHAAVLAIVPESPVRKRGAKGFTAFYRYSGERSQGLSVGGTRVLDILSSGRQTVLPPSLHPAGGQYEWVTPLTLADVSPADLPSIPASSIAHIQKLFRPEPERPARKSYSEPYTEATDADIADALSFIPADDYDVWIRVGMALKQHLGEGGLALWDRWSGRSHKYDPRGCAAKWRSFRRTDITVASVFYMAMDQGYARVSSTVSRPGVPSVIIEEGGNLSRVRKRTAPAVSTPAPDVLNPPGLVGRIARWINETAIYPQPVLSVASAITLTGVAMAHKVQSPTRLRTNFYTLGLAPSGAGKDHARKCVVNLLRYSGLDGLLGGEPASSAGLLTAIREGSGRCLIQWDEFGRVLRQLTHRNASSHQADILRAMVELFSCAGSVYAGVQYADHEGKMKRKPIDQPCLSIYGTTVPENFFSSITQSDAVDGFLARFLVMESTEYSVKAARPAADINEPPEALLDELRRWKDAPSNYDPKGNIDGVLRICPMVVSYSSEAEQLIESYSEKMRALVVEESAKRSGLSSIFARSAEHAIKLALVAHEGEVIGAEAMRWGIAMADWCGNYLTQAVVRNVASNEFERAAKKLLAIIREAGDEGVTQNTITRRTQELNARQRGEILTNLVEGQLVRGERIQGDGADKPTTVYRALTHFDR
jgi:hypothetical protein